MIDLLEIEVAMPYVAEVVMEVFTGGPEICLRVTEEQVERVFQLVVAGRDEERAEHIGILQAMTKVCKTVCQHIYTMLFSGNCTSGRCGTSMCTQVHSCALSCID